MNRFLRPIGLIAFIVSAGLAILASQPVAHAQGGPTVHITAPTGGATLSNPVTVTVTTSGAVIKDAALNDPSAAHLHYFIDRDPATILQPGQPIPSGQADIIHTPNTSQVLPSLSPGPHNVWVVLAHTDHTPYSPNVQDEVSFTVGGGQGTTAAAGAPAAAVPLQLPPGGMGGLLSTPDLGEHSLLAAAERLGTDFSVRLWLTLVAAGVIGASALMRLRRQQGEGDSRT
jgi:hypothetical protein